MTYLKKNKWRLSLFIFFSIVNIIIFAYRDSFQYKPYQSNQQLYTNCKDKSCLKKWTFIQTQFDEKELQEARTISIQSAGITNSDNTELKMEKIFLLLYKQFNDQISAPSLELSLKPPLQKYFALQNNNEKLWCGTFAELYTFFCAANNIICRYVEIVAPAEHHVINECFIPEKNAWALVDVTTNVFKTEKNGNSATLLDLANGSYTRAGTRVAFCDNNGQLQSDTITNRLHTLTSFLQPTSLYYYYYRTDLQNVYSWTGKLKRYILPQSWYALYSFDTHSNFPYFIKLLALLSWIFITIHLIFLKIYDRS